MVGLLWAIHGNVKHKPKQKTEPEIATLSGRLLENARSVSVQASSG